MSMEKKINLKKPKKWWVWVLAIIVIANISSGWDKEEVAKQSLLLQGFSQISHYLNFFFFQTSIVLKI
ncbi:hypothetical protein [Peribacillus sp. NPDC096448]|uniref:hypothetical protein n=1 Tax=Peribacillus sp. NPDC096448 TaxID=3364395 RepID=UPI00380CAAE7